MATKYIVNNLTGQTITGNLTVNGNLSVTGVTSGSLGVYKSLLTQTGPITATSIGDFIGNAFIIGETYTITNYVSSDDFSNIADVQSGTINQTGCVFIATGQTPNIWADGSELVSDGGIVETVLENNLGYNILWFNDTPAGPGVYVGINETTGPLYNSFNRINTSVTTQLITPTVPLPYVLSSGVGSLPSKDNLVFIAVYDYFNGTPVTDSLFYTPVHIYIKQDLDTTFTTTYGYISTGFPFGNINIDIICGDYYVDTIVGDSAVVGDISELITQLNSYSGTNVLGTFSDDGAGGLLLEMETKMKNQFCSSGTLTFNVYGSI
jgi:hypothetical protein